MHTSRGIAAIGGLAAAAAIASWLLTAEARGVPPGRDFSPAKLDPLVLAGPAAAQDRRDLLARAQFRARAYAYTHEALPDYVECQYLKSEPTGTSAKFDCVLPGGSVIKVKYNNNPEIPAEVAATRLLTALGYPTDRMDIVAHVRCFGCPRYPFFTAQVLSLTSLSGLLDDRGLDGYTDFRWVAVERKLPAPAIETAAASGWGWHELDGSRAPPAEVDALRLLAVFLAHWDNKRDNQRLVCLDDDQALPCDTPLAMIQDLGATFGPTKVNLAQWHALPIWSDRAACEVTMRHLPWEGATFGTIRISDGGRVQLGRQLAAFTDTEIRALFAEARFPGFYAGTDDERDLRAWTAAFRHRVDQIVSGPPCPPPDGSIPSRSSAPSY